MKQNFTPQQKADAALNSLDGLQPAEANPYLYTRIQQRLLNRTKPEKYTAVMFRLAMVLLMFIAANVITYEKLTAKPAATKSATGIEAFATEYGLSDSDENI